MPSLAKFVGHNFPTFSIVDSLVSLRGLLFTTRYGDSNATPSRSRKADFKKLSASELDKNPLKGDVSFDAHDVELGNVTHATTRVEDVDPLEVNRLKGIHVQRAWEYTSQQRERELVLGR